MRVYRDSQYIKCRWCKYKTLRFYKRKVQTERLFIHVIENHEEEVRKLLGVEESIFDYISTIDYLEDRPFGYI